MNFTSIIKEIGRGAKAARALPREQAQELFGEILNGTVPDMELGAILMALRIKGEAQEELAGFKAALDEQTRQVSVPEGPRCAILPTYSGARKEANLMPLLALILARRGIPVLIHGRHDDDSRSNTFKLLELLGIPPQTSLPEASAELASRKLACLRLDMLARGLDWLLAQRQRMGVRNSGHTLAKLLDPCRGRSVRVVPVTHPAYLDKLETLLREEAATALLMRGAEGEAYATPGRRPRLLGFQQGREEVLFEQQDFDDTLPETALCRPEDNARLIRDMLEGRLPTPQPLLDLAQAIETLARGGEKSNGRSPQKTWME